LAAMVPAAAPRNGDLSRPRHDLCCSRAGLSTNRG
jgi:hypothetical protein